MRPAERRSGLRRTRTAPLQEVCTSTTHVDRSAPASGTTTVPFRLEVVVIPVADFDRAKDFYVGLGWRVDAAADSGTG